jgi:hypothetical protein
VSLSPGQYEGRHVYRGELLLHSMHYIVKVTFIVGYIIKKHLLVSSSVPVKTDSKLSD